MEFHTFGDRNGQSIILIHGVLTPWQIWEKQIAALKEDYYVIAPALDAHTEEYSSEYISVEKEAESIEAFIADNLSNKVFALCGLSMGGAIANRLFERGKTEIDNLILDGAPLVKISALAERFMTNAYKEIVHKSKIRDEKTLKKFKRDFLPEIFLPSYLKFVDTMSDSSVENMIHSVCSTIPVPCENTRNTRILFMHGTKGNEVYSKRAAKKLKTYYPNAVIKCFDGLKHAELAIYRSDEWLRTVNEFLADKL